MSLIWSWRKSKRMVIVFLVRITRIMREQFQSLQMEPCYAVPCVYAHNGDKNSYMDFYMDVPGESIYPEEETKVKPAEAGSPYAYLADRDVDLMMETVMVGIDTLMTTDKAILSLWPTFKTYIQNQMKQKQ